MQKPTEHRAFGAVGRRFERILHQRSAVFDKFESVERVWIGIASHLCSDMGGDVFLHTLRGGWDFFKKIISMFGLDIAPI